MGKTNLQGKVATALTIAGSDSGGGAGIQADLKSFSAHGVYGASVITAITAQNTRLVSGIEAVSPGMIGAQIDAVLSDIRIDAIKIGMLATPAVIKAVAVALARYNGPIVLDPVMVAKSGDALLRDDAVSCLTEMLLPRASLLTPNIPEAARLLEGQHDISPEEQAKALLALGPAAVLMKGGHANGAVCHDYLITSSATAVFEAPRIATENTHGTGCSLSSAIAAGLAKSMPLEAAVGVAHRWLHGAIKAADELDIGQGHGPVHHFYDIWR
ncbi:MAG: bifunctional hydroxymethylpyrimidine kinase/phosphomethylpyrimidine kinase [Candidatus Puniceispirillum sp.]|nr:bifunctional hydroxymethylpyrimidine kinase/phosphomethylpyrimidine kinase [Candidatus Puniceispirillum sp.]MBL6774672.1 bifunctional hydroxymethylpyrimidine kinase/phosphomethylpyrimidine kinase [Candidatus Puniceispirillum sp.]